MPSNYEKLSRPSGPSLDTTVTLPEKAAFSTTTTACPDDTPRMSTTSTPRSDKSTNPFDTDIEAMVPTHTTDSAMHKTSSSPLARKSDCQVWPGKDHWKQKAKAAKARNRCTCMAKLSPRNRIIAKVLIVFLIVGVAVGVGFGVSKPLNAPIWGDKDNKH
ncbi:hypothetical protein ACJ41O_010569 [Fusarium nematophilum]